MSELTAPLQIENLGGGRWSAPHPTMDPEGRDVVFSGQILAQMIMALKLPVRLRVMIPAVENSVSGSSYRPGDVLTSRKGITVEIGNTDAEGRLILCDALHEGASEKPANFSARRLSASFGRP